MDPQPSDQNHVHTKFGVSCIDGVTLIPIAVNPVTNGVKVDVISTISDAARNAPRNADHTPSLMGVSSVDEVTPVPIFVNADGEILIDM